MAPPSLVGVSTRGSQTSRLVRWEAPAFYVGEDVTLVLREKYNSKSTLPLGCDGLIAAGRQHPREPFRRVFEFVTCRCLLVHRLASTAFLGEPTRFFVVAHRVPLGWEIVIMSHTVLWCVH